MGETTALHFRAVPRGTEQSLGAVGKSSEQVLHLKSAAADTYLPSWPLDVTASALSSTLTTFSTFSLQGEKRRLRQSNEGAEQGSSLSVVMTLQRQ